MSRFTEAISLAESHLRSFEKNQFPTDEDLSSEQQTNLELDARIVSGSDLFSYYKIIM